MSFSIDKGVPLPPKIGRTKYPFRSMVRGDSFFVPGKFCASVVVQMGKRMNAVFAQRKVVENGVSGTRIWRVS